MRLDRWKPPWRANWILFWKLEQAQEICILEGASRVLSVVKIDYKKEGVTMDEKFQNTGNLLYSSIAFLVFIVVWEVFVKR